ncbi:hypothetical protein GALMADRAFT_257408 [Galerina marginata CBS 339.88]|uniref:Uncharacterized protein n=1 Tax=Galerina marginata (strain CBS 339.88) TaxID=685588 RepID=A0A067SD78_GALM3|nr:hypothetical protein GALMADRAFT_257408 [Galerina marginata CBS 339.88]
MPPVVPIVVTASSSSSSSHSQFHSPTAPSTSHTHHGSPTPTFSEHLENTHRVEFEAPLSADVDGGNTERERRAQLGQGRFSIDLSLELERELANMESPPTTPAHDTLTHSDNNTQHPTHPQPRLPPRRESLSQGKGHGSGVSELAPDPEILAHIVTQLRQSLADMTRERDDLVKMLAQANQRDAETQDALQAMTDNATEAGEELTAARKKMKEDEEQIVLLRAKVEESRRGLMRLQTENRRQSMAPIDVSRASSMSLSAFASPPSSKRASFVPLTGSMQAGRPGHKRVSSVSDTSLAAFSSPELTPSPNVHAFNIAATEATLSGAPSSSRRFSGLFGRQSPPEGEGLLSAASADSSIAASQGELDAMRKELQAIKDKLETAQHELIEAKEAKEASETCVTALREFIADNNIGAGENTASVKLPPPPMMTTGAEEFAESKRTGSGWGFKLWGNNMDSAPKSSTGGAVPHSASVAPSPIIAASSMPPPPASATPMIGAAPISRKLGGFFSSRSSISSSHSREQSQPAHQLPPLQTNAGVLRTSSQRDSVYSYSDASSVAEPISPGSDINGLGTAGFVKATGLGGEDMVVHEVTNLDGTPVRVSVSAVDLDGLR